MSEAAAIEGRRVLFTQGGLLVKTLETEGELRGSYELRHRIFAERLRWVPESEERLESDVYDTWSRSLGVFSEQGRLLGIVRLTHAPLPFMLESEFSACLVGVHRVRKQLDTAEITRLAVDPHITDRNVSAMLLRTLFKGMYWWCRLHDVRYTYMVVEHRLLKVVQRMGWPCRPISDPVALPPADVLSIAALLDLEEFRGNAEKRRRELLAWLSTPESEQKVPAR
jgi:acyl homoserine lactone synthase